MKRFAESLLNTLVTLGFMIVSYPGYIFYNLVQPTRNMKDRADTFRWDRFNAGLFFWLGLIVLILGLHVIGRW